MYTQTFSRPTPGCIVFLIDRSDSMKSPWAGSGMTLAQGAARAINKILLELCIRSIKEQGGALRNYFYVGCYGYGYCPSTGGEGVESVLPGALAPRGIVPLPELADQPAGRPRGAVGGRRSPASSRIPIWVEPHHGYRTPMCAGVRLGREPRIRVGTQTSPTRSRRSSSTSPTAWSPTARIEGADLAAWASRLTTIKTSDGQALLLNIFLSPSTAAGGRLPRIGRRPAGARAAAVLDQQSDARADGRAMPGRRSSTCRPAVAAWCSTRTWPCS